MVLSLTGAMLNRIHDFFSRLILIALCLGLVLQPFWMRTIRGEPSWLTESKMFDYTFKVYEASFINGSDFVYSDQGNHPGSFSWSVLWTNASFVGIMVNVSIAAGSAFGKPTVPRIISESNVSIDVNSRNMFMGGRLVGESFLWLPVTVGQGDIVPMAGTSPGLQYGKVEGGTGYVSTSQGTQPIFTVESITNGSTFGFEFFGVRTGLLVGGDLDQSSVNALGMNRLDVTGLYLSYSNIDLGPPDLLREIAPVLSIAAIPTVIFTAGFLLYGRKRRRKAMRHRLNRVSPHLTNACGTEVLRSFRPEY